MRLQLEATAKSKQLTEVRIYPVAIISCVNEELEILSNVIASSEHSNKHVRQKITKFVATHI